MKTIIAGSRTITDMAVVELAIAASGFEITEVVSGGAAGVDLLGYLWAQNRGLCTQVFPAEWKEFGASAGFRRNLQMAEYADALIAVWDGVSRGTGHMINIAKRWGLKVHIHVPPGGRPVEDQAEIADWLS